MTPSSSIHQQAAAVAVATCIILLMTTPCNASLFNVSNTHGEACILVDIEFRIKIGVAEGNGSVSTRILNSETEGLSVSGMCGSRSAALNFQFPNSSNWGLIFNKGKHDDVTLDRVFQFYPQQLFGDKKFKNKLITFNDPRTTPLSLANESYMCLQSENTIYDLYTGYSNFNFSVAITVVKIQAQAYEVKNNSFSSPFNCETNTTLGPATEDTTPMSSGTTTAMSMKTSSPSKDAIIKCNVKSKTSVCITLEGNLGLKIYYDIKRKGDKHASRTSTNVWVPAHFRCHRGNCGTEEQLLQIGPFFKGWSLKIKFQKRNKTINALTKGEFDLDYSISNISLTYIIDKARFSKDAVNLNKTITVSIVDDDLPRKSKQHGFYECDAKTDIKISNDVIFQPKHLKFKAFNNNNNETFTGEPARCSADDDSDDHHLPIIIGSIIGGITLIIIVIIIIYSVVKCRKYQNYEDI